jgi:hypothetical protein
MTAESKQHRISTRRNRRVLVVAGVAALILLGITTWLIWPTTNTPPAPRERQYLDFTACLLTDQHGIQGPDAAPVWAGMQEASLATHAKVQYLSVTGPQTSENAATFLAGLTQGRCHLVFAAGETPTTAVRQNAQKFAAVTFYAVGNGTDTANLKHVTTTSTADVQKAVIRAITEAVDRYRR